MCCDPLDLTLTAPLICLSSNFLWHVFGSEIVCFGSSLRAQKAKTLKCAQSWASANFRKSTKKCAKPPLLHKKCAKSAQKVRFCALLALFLKLVETPLFAHFNVFAFCSLRLEPKYTTQQKQLLEGDSFKNLFLSLFLMGCFPGDFQGPLRHLGEQPIKVRERPMKEGETSLLRLMGLVRFHQSLVSFSQLCQF